MPLSRYPHWARYVAGALLCMAAAACFIITKTTTFEIAKGSTVNVTSPLKVHLIDGSIVVFHDGARVSPTGVAGAGRRYTPTLRETPSAPSVIPIDSVLGIEA